MQPKQRILLVEDNPTLLKMYKTKFLMEGFDVDSAMDGEEAIVKVNSFKPQVILLDYMIPKINGLKVLEILRSDENLGSVPIIMLTNTMTADKVEEATKLGASGYLLKAVVTPNEVVNVVRRALEKA